MRRLSRKIATAAAIVAVGTLLIGAPGASAGSSDPLTYSKEIPEAVISRAINPPPYATLEVPAGRWVAWAEVTAFTEADLPREVRCTLSASNGSGRVPATSSQTGYVVPVAYDDTDVMILSASLKSPNYPVTFSMQCRDTTGSAPTPSTSITLAEATRIVAMRLSDLTPTRLPDLTGTSTAGQPGGTLAPAQLIHGYRTANIAIPKSNTAKTVTKLALSPGMWSIRASWSIASTSSNDGRDPTNNGQCQIILNNDRSGPLSSVADRVAVSVLDPGYADDREAFYLDTSGRLTKQGAARLQCWQQHGTGDLVIRNLRITALRLGTLKLANASDGIPTTSYGSGVPYERFARTQGSFTLPAATGGVYTTVGHLKLPAGDWFLYAKVSHNAADLSCYIESSSNFGPGSDSVGGELAMQDVVTVQTGEEATMNCYNSAPQATTLSYLHITAIRVQDANPPR